MENKTDGNQTPLEAESNQESETRLVSSRRKALKKIAVGGTIAAGASALPPRWTKPIIDKVFVPAHAQTSPPPATTAAPTPTQAPATTQPIQTLFYRGTFELQFAAPPPPSEDITLCASITGDSATVNNETAGASGTGTVSGGVTILAPFDNRFEITFVSVDNNAAVVTVERFLGSAGTLTSSGTGTLNNQAQPCP